MGSIPATKFGYDWLTGLELRKVLYQTNPWSEIVNKDFEQVPWSTEQHTGQLYDTDMIQLKS